MIIQKRISLVCLIPDKNKRAFYELIAGQDLFGFILFRHWGRIGTKGRTMQQRFRLETDMLSEFDDVYKTRIKHQYVQVTNKKAKSLALKSRVESNMRNRKPNKRKSIYTPQPLVRLWQ